LNLVMTIAVVTLIGSVAAVAVASALERRPRPRLARVPERRAPRRTR